MNDNIIAVIRTAVPTLVGALAAWSATIGIELDETTKSALAVFLTGAFGTVYYAGVRWVASKVPWAEWLLGYPAVPVYVTAQKAE